MGLKLGGGRGKRRMAFSYRGSRARTCGANAMNVTGGDMANRALDANAIPDTNAMGEP